MLVTAAILAVLSLADIVTPLSLLTLTFFLGVGTALTGPAWQAIQPELVPRGRVPPGHRPRRPHVQPRPGGRTGPRRCGRGARRAGLGVPDQRHLVPGRRGRAHLVAAAGVDLDVAGRDHDRRHAGRAALRPELDRAAPRAHPLRGVRRPAGALLGLLPVVARDRLGLGVRRLRPPARVLRRRCCGRRGPAAAHRRRAQPGPHPAREHRDHRPRAAHRRRWRPTSGWSRPGCSSVVRPGPSPSRR